MTDVNPNGTSSQEVTILDPDGRQITPAEQATLAAMKLQLDKLHFDEEKLMTTALLSGTTITVGEIVSKPYLYNIAEHEEVGHIEFELFGVNNDIDVVVEDVWENGGTYVWPTAEMQMELVSTSVEDDPMVGATPGTGVRTVTIIYLDDTFAEKTEDIDLNGTGVVTTVATDIYRVNRIEAKTVGSTGAAVGTISLRHLSDSPIYTSITPGNTRTRKAMYTVPLGYDLYITSATVGLMYLSTNQIPNNSALLTVRANYSHRDDLKKAFFLPHAEIPSGLGGFYRPFELPLHFPEGIDVKCSAISAANNCPISVGLRGWMELNT
jgi:hypothetical protein